MLETNHFASFDSQSINYFSTISQIKVIFRNFDDAYEASSSLNDIKKALVQMKRMLNDQKMMFLRFFNDIIDHFVSLLYFSMKSLIYNEMILSTAIELVCSLYLGYRNEKIFEEWTPLLLNRLVPLSSNENEEVIAQKAEGCVKMIIMQCYKMEEFSQIFIDLLNDEDISVANKAKEFFFYLIDDLDMSKFADFCYLSDKMKEMTEQESSNICIINEVKKALNIL